MIDHYIIKKQDHVQLIIYILIDVIQLEKEIKREFYKLKELYKQVYHSTQMYRKVQNHSISIIKKINKNPKIY